MNRKALAIVGAFLGVVVVGGVTVSSISATSPELGAPTADDVAVARPTAVAPRVPASPPAISPATPAPRPSATPLPTPTLVPLPKLSEKVKGASKVRYFPVKGDSPAALLDSTVERSEAKCKSDDTLACVLIRPNIRWTDRTRLATGACTIVAPHVSVTSTVNLPRWKSAKPVEPALLAWWSKMVDHMAWHEGQHIKIANRYEAKLINLMAGEKCSSANKIIKKWNKSVRAAQAKFDAKDLLWPYPEYTGTWGSSATR